MHARVKVDVDPPIHSFQDCHAGIVSRLQAMSELPRLAAEATRSRKVAADVLALFRDAVLEHHGDEEKELFPAVLRSALPGPETMRVQEIVDRLVREHRAIERMWRQLEPQVRAAARGEDVDLDSSAVELLVSTYQMHANFEEQQFLPLAERILGRNANHMAALGLALHVRHAPRPLGYV
jgi:hemerythrin-like domain-containing protein